MPPPPAPLVWPDSDSVRSALAFLLVFAAIVVVLQVRARGQRPPPAPSPDEPLAVRALGWFGALVGAAIVALQTLRFRYAYDDFGILGSAAQGRLEAQGGLRYLSNGLRIVVAQSLGGRPVYAALNAVAVLGMFVGWRIFLRNSGLSAPRATAAAAVGVATAPGLFLMQLQLTGFEQVGTMAFVLGALAAFDAASRCPDTLPRRQLALAATGAFLVACAVFCKLPTAVLAPASVAAAMLVTDRAIPAGRRLLVAAAAGASWLVPLLLWSNDVSAELNKAGGGRRLEVLHEAFREVIRVGSGEVRVMIVGVVLGLALRALPFARTPIRWPDRRFALRMGVLALAMTAPFLANSTYWTPYYLLLASLPVSALVIELAAGFLPGSFVGVPVAAAIVVAAVPLDTMEILVRGEDTYVTGVAPLLEDVAKQAHALNPANDDHVAFDWQARCDDPRQVERTLEDIQIIAEQSGLGEGLRWATGWRHARVTYARAARTTVKENDLGDDDRPYRRLRIDYCVGRPPVVVAEN